MKPGEQDAEIWKEIERFAQLPDDAVSQKDAERLYAALTKAEAAWRTRVVRRPKPQPAASAARPGGMPDTVWVRDRDRITWKIPRATYERWARGRAAELIELREQGWSYDRIADCVGLSRERVRQIVVREKALDRSLAAC